MYHLIKRTLLATALAITVVQAAADETTEQTEGIIVEDAVVTPARRGETAYLYFKVTNIGVERAMLLSVQPEIPSVAQIILTAPEKEPQVITQLLILREETLDFASSHIRVELKDIQTPIEAGSTLKFDLVFRRFTTSASAHAH